MTSLSEQLQELKQQNKLDIEALKEQHKADTERTIKLVRR